MRTTERTRRHPWLALGAGVVSVSALGGAVTLATGSMALGATVEARFPFHSTVLAGFALALVVALPMAVAAYLSWTGSAHAAETAMAAGALLVGWIAVQLVVIRTFSWLQPAMALAGVLVFAVGLGGRALLRTQR